MLQSQPEYFKSKVQEWTGVYAQSTVNITVESDVRQEGQEINLCKSQKMASLQEAIL